MSVPVGPSQISTSPAAPAPITNAGSGAGHQIVRMANEATFTPVHYVVTLAASVLAGGIRTVAYSETIVASGGTAAYAFSTTGGTLPTGLSLNSSTGVLSGTPTALGTFSFTITATDANGFTGSQAFSISVTDPAVVNYGFVA